ncbi:hypothetical protein ACP70R_028780 [Stipagrostis hirtigluma subsp. patula]
MGACFSSWSSEEAAGYGGEETQRRVYRSDTDGRSPYVGEYYVDNKAAAYIDHFHRHQFGACDCADGADQPQQQAPLDAAAS